MRCRKREGAASLESRFQPLYAIYDLLGRRDVRTPVLLSLLL